MGAQAARSWALFTHVRGIDYTFAIHRPSSATIVKVNAIGYVLVCLAVTPLLISVVVVGCCAPRQVMFAVLVGA